MTRFEEIRELRLDQLVVSSQQARTRGVERGLDELVDNIRVHGQLEPILVVPTEGTSDLFEIIAGQRRYLALKQLNSETILAAIFARDARDDARVLSISENMIRRDLDSMDLIDACTEWYRKYGSLKAVSEELGLPYEKVRSYVKFERLQPRLKELVTSGTLTVKSAIGLENYMAKCDTVGDLEFGRLVDGVAGMTQAQQTNFLNHADRSSNGAQVAEGSNGSQSQTRRVRQIVVTLREEHYDGLRAWASKQSLTQDRAAATMIADFLSGLTRRQAPPVKTS